MERVTAMVSPGPYWAAAVLAATGGAAAGAAARHPRFPMARHGGGRPGPVARIGGGGGGGRGGGEDRGGRGGGEDRCHPAATG